MRIGGMGHAKTPWTILLGWALCTASGCQDATFRERQSVRDQRMSDLLATVPQMQESRNVNMARVLSFHEELRARRIKHLGQTVGWAQELAQERSVRGQEEPFFRDIWFRNIVTGHPEKIHRTWADMVY